MTMSRRSGGSRLLRASAVAVGLSLLLAACYSRGALDHRAASPDTRPWYCNAVGDGTPPSGHGNGAHVHPIYEGMKKGKLSWDDCRELSAQLDLALNSVKGVMTRGEAEAAGWRELAHYLPGLGTHHSQGFFMPRGGPDGAGGSDGSEEDSDATVDEPSTTTSSSVPQLPPFDPAQPTFLIFGGEDADAPLVGVSYAAFGSSEPPEAFAGDNDWWHLHEKICWDDEDRRILAGAEEIPDEECEALGGRQIPLGPGIWLLHLWMVPDYALKYDIFASGHPCLGESGPLPGDDPCWDLANHEPADGPPPWDEHGAHDGHEHDER